MFSPSSKKRKKQRHSSVSPLMPASLVFLAVLVIIGSIWRTATKDIELQKNTIVNQNAAYIENTLKQRFNVYEDSLRAANGLFLSSENVNRTEWGEFVRSLDLPRRYPGIRGLGYIKIINSNEKAVFEEGIQQEGLNGFNVHPQTDKDLLAPILYYVPLSDTWLKESTSLVLGYDAYSDPLRQEAMVRSASTGLPALTSVLDLLKTDEFAPSRGFLMYMPSYKKNMPLLTAAERTAAIDGYFYAPFINNAVFTTLFTNNTQSFAFAINQGLPGETSQIFSNVSNFNDANYGTIKRSNLQLYGQKWNIIYKVSNDIIPLSVRARPKSILLGGVIFSLALASIIYLLIQRRARALQYDEQLKLEKAKDELLSLASHQLRTPATAVKQYVSMVKNGFAGNITGEQSRLLQMAYDSNERQLTIVDDLLYVARIDAGRAALRPENVDIISLIQSVLDDHRTVIKTRNQKISFVKPKKSLVLMADPQYLRMILENLLSNASKYSHGLTKIKIVLKNANNHVYISFIDKGVGIDPKDFPSVFHKFNRIPNELTRQIPGSGIGLYLAKQLAILHGGDITFVSVPKKGSTFTVMLPAR